MINNRNEGGLKASEGSRDEVTNGVRGVAHALEVGAGTATSATSAKQDSTKPYIAFQAVISFFRFT